MKIKDIITEAVKQRLDPKCWKGKHKEGTKIKGGIRVNNCVPNEGVAEGLEQDYLSQIPNLIWKPVSRGVWNTIQEEGLDEEQDALNHTDWAMASLSIDPKDAQALQAFDSDAIEDFNRFDIHLKSRYPGLTDLIDYDRGTVTIVKTIQMQGVAEGLQNIEIQDDKSIVTISIGGKERFVLQPATGHKLKSYGGRAYRYWTIYDIERKKDRFNPNIGMMSKNQAIAYVNKIIQHEEDAAKEKPGVAEDRPIPKAESGKAVALSNLGKFHAGVDTLGKWVPERLTHQFALDPNKWEHTFYSLTLKEPKKIRYYRPKNVDIVPGTLVGDMAIANQFYRTKDPAEQEKYALAYLASLKPYPVNLDDYEFPELLIPRKEQGVAEGQGEEFDLIETIIENLAKNNGVDAEAIWEDLESLSDDELYVFATTTTITESEAWQKANKKDKTDGMSQKAVNSYRRAHPGSKLKTAVTTKPGKLKKGSKASKRRKSYCSRSRGQMKMHSISCAKTPDKAICKARRRWNC